MTQKMCKRETMDSEDIVRERWKFWEKVERKIKRNIVYREKMKRIESLREKGREYMLAKYTQQLAVDEWKLESV